MHLFQRDDLKDSTTSLFADEIQVRFQDVDAAGVAYFARVFDYLHAAYEGLLESVGEPLPAVLAERRWAAPLRHAELDYFLPLRFGDRLTVHVALAHVEPTEITFGYRLEDAEGRVAAVGQTVHTFVDPKTWQRCELPSALRRVLSG
ncbi:MAG TPA: thioesterase family protein [Polyangiaceae bacterium]|nr:thioesterase family protein [Polyangiaceae bacterium]